MVANTRGVRSGSWRRRTLFFLVRTRNPEIGGGDNRLACEKFGGGENSGPPVVFFLRINAHDDLSLGREAQQLGASQEINGTIWTLTDIAYTLMAFGEEALLGDNPVAIQHQPHKRLRIQPTNE